MVAIPTHVVYVRPTNVDNTGKVVLKNDSSIRTMLVTNTEMRIVPDQQSPNSLNYPTIKDYIIAEAASGYLLVSITSI